MNVAKLANNPRATKALIGLSWQEFSDLIPVFEQALHAVQRDKPGRKRMPGGGQKGHLPTTASKLFFILLYLKTYPTFDVLAFFCDKSRGRTCEYVHIYANVLERALGRKQVLPQRRINSVEEFLQRYPAVKDVLLDGTERRIQRPKNPRQQRRQYSGKKKTTTRKNIVMTDEHKKILYLSPTKPGRRHDKRLTDKELLIEHLPSQVAIWVDSGFQGIQKQRDNYCMPKKATKYHPLSSEEKKDNKLISGVRVLVEHAIGGVKRFGVVSHTFRNKLKAGFDDQVIVLSSGLWNYHLDYVT